MDENMIAKPKVSYYFGPGYKDCKKILDNAWKRHYDFLQKLYLKNMSIRDNQDTNIILRYMFSCAIIFATASLVIFGSVLTAILSIFHIVVLLIFMAAIYFLGGFICLLDLIFRKYNKIKGVACTSCHTKQEIPWYECPKCHKWHTKLRPGKYGLWKRTCECGEKLPTNFFNGRQKLNAICSNPECPSRLIGKDRGYQTFWIPVIGGTSVGKTAYLTAFWVEFKKFMKSHNISYNACDNNGNGSTEVENLLKEMEKNYNLGDTIKTAVGTGAISLNFQMNHKSFLLPRIMHLYDIAGEVFSASHSVNNQKQYDYSTGFILVIDPLSLENVRERLESSLKDRDKNSLGSIDQEDTSGIVAEKFLEKLRQVSNLSNKSLAKTPLAVIINKIDIGNISNEVGMDRAKKLYQKYPKNFNSPIEAEDYLCRKFLAENSGKNLLMTLQNNFEDIRFFAVSSIGHTAGEGEFSPVGVLTPVEWIISKADKSGLYAIWQNNTFKSKTKMWKNNDEIFE